MLQCSADCLSSAHYDEVNVFCLPRVIIFLMVRKRKSVKVIFLGRRTLYSGNHVILNSQGENRRLWWYWTNDWSIVLLLRSIPAPDKKCRQRQVKRCIISQDQCKVKQTNCLYCCLQRAGKAGFLRKIFQVRSQQRAKLCIFVTWVHLLITWGGKFLMNSFLKIWNHS
jgi:hypothetical protein